MEKLRPYLKALFGAAVAATAAAEIAYADDVISGQEWFKIAGAGLAALAVIWAVPNDEAKA